MCSIERVIQEDVLILDRITHGKAIPRRFEAFRDVV